VWEIYNTISSFKISILKPSLEREFAMYLGIDCGTQGLKVILLDQGRGVIASASESYELIEGLPAGFKEQDPQIWVDALEASVAKLLKQSADLSALKGIGVSGQQHGLVVLDKDKKVIRPAKLWCDTSTQAQCESILQRSNGQYITEIGNGLPPGFTASKLLWLKENEKENYDRIAHFMLPHDYLNFYLTGEIKAEAGDASGSGYFNVKDRCWSEKALSWIDPQRDLKECLPELIEARDAVGTVRSELADSWKMPKDVLVSSGGGDNMMGAIGSGNVSNGCVTVSLGTSGTLFSYNDKPVIDPQSEVAAFCDSTGAWMPLACTLNVTATTEMIRKGFFEGHSVQDFDQKISEIPAGSDGLFLLPYLEGERLPNIPEGTGVLMGLRDKTANPYHLARAAMEGVTLGLDYGMQRFKSLGVQAAEVRLIGGGAKSPIWRQICADIFNLPIVCLTTEEGPAMGAALQALWCCEKSPLKDIVAENLALNEDSRCLPIEENVVKYKEINQLSVKLSKTLQEAGSFQAHRKYLNNI
jgi:xylulokinase